MTMSVRERIIEKTTEMFVRYGVKSVRMDDIADAMGISKRTIYETFGDKENLIEACVKHFFEGRNEYVCKQTANASSIIEELLINLSAGEEAIKQSFMIMNDLEKFYPKVHKSIMEESYEAGTREMKEKLERGIKEGVLLANMDVDMVVALFIDIMQTVFARLNALPQTVMEASASSTLKYCVVFFARGIATQEGIRMIDEYLSKKEFQDN